MNRIKAEEELQDFFDKSKVIHTRKLLSIEQGNEPIKTFLEGLIFETRCILKMILLKVMNFRLWRKIVKDIKNNHPYYLSRHYYMYNARQQIFTIKPYKFLVGIEKAILSFRKGDENYFKMLENDKKSKKYKRNLYNVMLNRFLYINIHVMRKVLDINERITKKKVKYTLRDNQKRKDIYDGTK